MDKDLMHELFKFLPAGGGAGLFAITLNQWVGIATFLYIIVQTLYLIRKWHREEKDWRGRPRRKKGAGA